MHLFRMIMQLRRRQAPARSSQSLYISSHSRQWTLAITFKHNGKRFCAACVREGRRITSLSMRIISSRDQSIMAIDGLKHHKSSVSTIIEKRGCADRPYMSGVPCSRDPWKCVPKRISSKIETEPIKSRIA